MAPGPLCPLLRLLVMGLGLALLCAAAAERVPGTLGAEKGLGVRGRESSAGFGDQALVSRRGPNWGDMGSWIRSPDTTLPRQGRSRLTQSVILSTGLSCLPVQPGGLLS